MKRVLVKLKIFLWKNSHPEKRFPKVYEKAKKDLDINSRSAAVMLFKSPIPNTKMYSVHFQ